jgi:hypothetical protein
MRGTRWLLLVAIAAIIFGVGVTYRKLKKSNRRTPWRRLPRFPPDVSSATRSGKWVTKDQKTGCISYELSSQGYEAGRGLLA